LLAFLAAFLPAFLAVIFEDFLATTKSLGLSARTN
jgi:hypothetical protein